MEITTNNWRRFRSVINQENISVLYLEGLLVEVGFVEGDLDGVPGRHHVVIVNYLNYSSFIYQYI